MSARRIIMVAMALAWSPTVHGQETPLELTRPEWGCERTAARALTEWTIRSGECLAACYEADKPACSFADTDEATRQCLVEGEARYDLETLRACARAACPECYYGGQCVAFLGDRRQAITSNTEFLISSLYCSDAFSPDGLSPAERRDRSRLVRAGARFVSALERCFARCHADVRSGRVPSHQACRVSFITLPQDPGTRRCIERAQRRFRDACEERDLPECLLFGCGLIDLALLVNAGEADEAMFCEDTPEECGDGRVTGAEQCDATAEPTGCAEGAICVDCVACEPGCGNGSIDPGEVCDYRVATSCGPASLCDLTCTACVSGAAATQSLTPCVPRVVDTWTFDVTAGQFVTVQADTIAAGTAADLCISLDCPDTGSEADDNIPCTFPPPEFSCPRINLPESSTSGTCTVRVRTCSEACADVDTAGYVLTVLGTTNLTLVSDDATPGSLSGAFIGMSIAK